MEYGDHNLSNDSISILFLKNLLPPKNLEKQPDQNHHEPVKCVLRLFVLILGHFGL